jgi:hypothetical protein
MRADRLLRLLQSLGDSNENVALSVRCRRTSKRLARGELDQETTQLYAHFTQEQHHLNLLLAQAFYPGTGDVIEGDPTG